MTSNRPYLIRAIYEWIVDNGLTPYLLVSAEGNEVEVPGEYVEDGRIVLSVSPQAVRSLDLGNEAIQFAARFSGRHFNVSVPVRCVLAIYAKENGKGIALADEEEPPPEGAPPEDPRRPRGRPRLRVVS